MEAILYGPFGQVALGSTIISLGCSPGNSLVIADPQVATYHAEIRQEARGYTITDLDSPYGTYINGQRIYPRAPYILNPGDSIKIGRTMLTYTTNSSTLGPNNTAMNAATIPASNNYPNPYHYSPAPTDPYTGYGEQQSSSQPPSLVPPPPPNFNISDVSKASIPVPNPVPKRSRLWLLVSGLVIVLIVGSVAVWILLSGSTPTKTLDAFCSNVQSKNYQNAYALISVDYQARYAEPNFKTYFSAVTSCTHNSVTTTNGDTTSTITLAPDSTYPWTYQVTLLKDSSGNWKIDSFSSAPDMLLDTFCTKVQSQNYQDAYNLTSLNYQRDVSESTFQSALTSATSCAHNQTTVSNATMYALLTFGPSSTFPWSYQAVMVKDSSGSWKIDNFNSLPNITLANFCSDIGNQDYTDAYGLTSVGFQNSVAETQFVSDRSGVVSCTYGNLSDSNGTVTATITYTMNDHSTPQQKATLVKDSNGDWRIDSFQNM